MKQLTVYDAIRTHARDVVRWQVREALEESIRFLATSGGWRAAGVRRKLRQRALQRRSMKRTRQYAAELATLKANVRAAVLAVMRPTLRLVRDDGEPPARVAHSIEKGD